ncbi:MAG TPA: hypothetical protein VMZ53_27135 [Kofleriaceae bacterium]|nr:hypothetical protein [Kofleriaceae bacterium]
MVRHVALVALTVVAACGDDSGQGQPADASVDVAVDAAPRQIVAHAVVRQIVNDASRSPVAGPEVLYKMSSAAQRTGERMDVTLPIGAAGDIGFATLDDRYRLSVALDTTTPTEFQMRATQLELSGRFVGRYDRTPPVAGTTLAATITNAPGTGTAVITSTGVWTQTGRSGGTNGSFTIDWSTQAASLGGPIGLLDAAQNDRAYYIVLDVTGTAPQYAAISSSCSADITMTAGAPTAFTCTAAPLAQSSCMHAQLHFAGETARITAITGSLYPNYFNNWLLQATATPSTGITSALLLAYQVPLASTTPSVDLDRNFTFGNPYPGTTPVLLMNTGKSRSFALPGTNAMNISATVNVYLPAAPDCATVTEGPTGFVAIPSLPRLDGVHLDSDAVTIGLASKLHTLTWDVASPGAADYWLVRVHRAIINGSNSTRLSVVRSYVTLDHDVVLDPADFTVGQTYFIEVQAVTGVPKAAMGDFREYTFPYATSSIFSSAFRITE